MNCTPIIRCLALALFLLPLSLHAHIGSPNVFFDGHAGPYPVRVVIRPPGVIPGLAQISVRVETNSVERVTVLPLRWDSGREGAPSPDLAVPVRGESNLYNAELWFMREGAQSVEVELTGPNGSGKVLVPVNASATRVLEMPRGLGIILASLSVFLVLLAVSIVGVAVRESVLPSGHTPPRRRVWLARVMAVLAFFLIAGMLIGGKRWWDKEALDYRSNRLYEPLEAITQVRVENGKHILRVERTIDPSRRYGPLVPDHGKLMHLFLVRESDMNAFAHLHPIKQDWKTFETSLPPLPSGTYRLYGDITYETGFAETLTATITLPTPSTASTSNSDPDDSWNVDAIKSAEGGGGRIALSTGHVLEHIPSGPVFENRELRLQFVVRDREGTVANVEPYMGMLGHLILQHEDGSVFTHLHPSGSYSMAAKQLFELRAEGKAPMKVASAKDDPICKLPPLDAAWARANPDRTISFPYAFPKPGRYRLWMQTKIAGVITTGAFDIHVSPEAMASQPKKRAPVKT